MLLAIDTSTHYASVAVHDGQRLLSERTWLANQDHTRTLLPNVQGVLDAAGATLSKLSGLAVALGPGSFNGLRVGLSTVKGFAIALDLPVIGVGTLELVAEEYDLPVVTTSAGRGQVYLWRRGDAVGAVELVDGVGTDYVRHAGTLARIGWQRLLAGQIDNATLLEPLYVHMPQVHGKALPAPSTPLAAVI